MPAWDKLRRLFPWPEVEAVDPYLEGPGCGWLHGDTARMLAETIQPGQLVLEIGSWLGLSARSILSLHPDVRLICVGHFAGSPEHHTLPECARLLPRLYETFIANMQPWRDRLVVMGCEDWEAIRILGFLCVAPDVIYLDAGHGAEEVQRQISDCGQTWPHAVLCGDDYCWASVAEGVQRGAADIHRVITTIGEAGWRLGPTR